jgi:tetratricopeptide (TPR) repeat protein
VSLLFAGCAARTEIVHAVPPPPGIVQVRAGGGNESALPQDSLRTFMTKVRELAAEARPQPRVPATTIEGSDRRLGLALAAAAVRPAAETFRAVAEEYCRLGVLDTAHEYLNKALRIDPEDAATHEALARLWRDSGFPGLGLGDAYRALHYAPSSAPAQNTLGTLLQALGHHEAARDRYERALHFDPTAAYALNNLCYVMILEGRPEKAVPMCREALRRDPAMAAARNNLGVAYAASGDAFSAQNAFFSGGDHARAFYNVGIVELARRRPTYAIRAFLEAQAIRPSVAITARLREAERLQKSGGGD